MKAMILAAGLGTRLKPFTDEHPKALAVVNSKTLLQRNIEYLQTFGIREVIINIHHFADQIRGHIRDHHGFNSEITFSDETDQVLETGGGLVRAAWFLKDSDPFVLMNADVLTDMDLSEMVEAHRKTNPVATLATTNRDTSRYFLFNRSGALCGWENVKTGEQRISRKERAYIRGAFSGIHVISPRIFDLIKQQGKFSMVEVYLHICGQNIIRSHDHSGTRFMDVGNPERLKQAESLFS